MRVFHIAYRYKPIIGGLERYIEELLATLAPYSEIQRVYQVESIPDDTVVRSVGKVERIPSQVGFAMRLRQLRAELSDADLLIVHGPEFYLPVSWHRNVLVVSHCATWTAESGFLRRTIRRAASRFAWRRAAAWVVNSTFVFRSFGYPTPPMCGDFQELVPGRWYVPNCVDTEKYSTIGPIDPEIESPKTVLVPRNFTAPRGIDLALLAAGKLAAAREIRLAFAGNFIYDHRFQKGYRKVIDECIAEMQLRDRLQFLGFVPPRRMPGVYRAAAMTLIPTRASEGTSLAALESMACGTATLSTAVEGLLDLPTEKCGLTADDMAEAILRVLADRSAIGQRQHDLINQRYNIQLWQSAWLRIVRSIAS